jgi:hypothetical protein
MYIACKYMCRRVSLMGGSRRGGREGGKAYASCCAAKAAAEKSYAYNMATADDGRESRGQGRWEGLRFLLRGKGCGGKELRLQHGNSRIAR